MREKKRWGNKFVDKRNWAMYNNQLVVRGEFFLDMEWVKSWNRELEEINAGKVGRPYAYPWSLIRMQAVWHQWIDYRGVEGITAKLVEFGQLPACNDYTDINRRVNALDVEFTLPKSGSVSVACDGSGMKFENSGEYRARMYGKKRRKYLKVVITADPIKRKLFECDVSIEGEGLSEPELAKFNMRMLMHNGLDIDKFFGDGSFDMIDLFRFLEENNIQSAIKVRKNSISKGEGTLRDKEVLEYRKKGYKAWASKRRYGLRWNGTEGIFSAVKRKFGEDIRSTKTENAIKETRRRFWVYDEMKEYAKAWV